MEFPIISAGAEAMVTDLLQDTGVAFFNVDYDILFVSMFEMFKITCLLFSK